MLHVSGVLSYLYRKSTCTSQILRFGCRKYKKPETISITKDIIAMKENLTLNKGVLYDFMCLWNSKIFSQNLCSMSFLTYFEIESLLSNPEQLVYEKKFAQKIKKLNKKLTEPDDNFVDE